MAETDLRYPTILCADGRVMDGMYRVAKAYLESRDEGEAVRSPETSEPGWVGVDLDTLPYNE